MAKMANKDWNNGGEDWKVEKVKEHVSDYFDLPECYDTSGRWIWPVCDVRCLPPLSPQTSRWWNQAAPLLYSSYYRNFILKGPKLTRLLLIIYVVWKRIPTLSRIRDI